MNSLPSPQVLEHLLTPADLSQNDLASLLDSMLSSTVDTAELYFQSSQHESWILEDGLVKEGGFSADKGVGVRAISQDKTGFAYSDEIHLPALKLASHAAKSIASQGSEKRIPIWQQKPHAHQLYPSHNPLGVWTVPHKIAFLQKLDAAARAQDPRIKQVVVSLSGVFDTILVACSDGTFQGDIRPLVRLNISVIAEENGRREQASSGGGGRGDYQMFLEQDRGLNYVSEAVRQALNNLKAKPAPAGLMPVVLGPGWPGVLLHEAIGHGLEGDFNRRGSSAFSNRIGEQVASKLCTIVDDGSLPNRRGSLNMDDEGTPSQCTVLIENGILKNYMQDKMNARLMGMQATGNGRRESYAHLPMPRMTNTYMLAGEDDPEDIIRSVKKGLYAVNFGGGQVDITSGKFVFSTSEAYMIEDGQISYPVKGATLIGSGPEILHRVSRVGHDLALDQGIGVCGKEGQGVPVGVGQPTLLLDEITVGGTQ